MQKKRLYSLRIMVLRSRSFFDADLGRLTICSILKQNIIMYILCKQYILNKIYV